MPFGSAREELLSPDQYLATFTSMQEDTVAVTREIAAKLQPGMSEKQIADDYYGAMTKVGLTEYWYPVLVYVGDSTALPISRRFHLPSPDVTVKDNDIIMLDCTPMRETVWSNWAETFSVGNDLFFEKLVVQTAPLL